MAISYSALEDAAKKIQDIRKLEDVIEISGIKVVIRCLDNREEIEASEFVGILQARYKEFGNPQAQLAAMSMGMRVGHLAYAIVQIGDVDLRNVEFIETANGESLPKVEAVANLILENWDSDVTFLLFMRFMAFSMECSVFIENQIKIETKNIEDEIEFHKTKLAELEEKMRLVRVQTVKEKLQDGIDGAVREGSSPTDSNEMKKVTLNLEDSEKVSTNEDEENQKTSWERIQSSFLDDSNPQESLEMETRRIAELQRQNQERRAQERQNQDAGPVLNKGLPEMPIRPKIPRRDVGPLAENLQNAFTTGVVIREPRELLEESSEPDETQQPSTNKGSLNPRFRNP